MNVMRMTYCYMDRVAGGSRRDATVKDPDANSFGRHVMRNALRFPRESGDPGRTEEPRMWLWVPACAGTNGGNASDQERHNSYRSSQLGSRFSMKAQMPSSASRAIMFSVITFEA